MDESEDNLSSEDMKSTDSPLTAKTKVKKRSLIERELETNLTARITSPMTYNNGTNRSRYGRARRIKPQMEQADAKKADLKSPLLEKTPIKAQNQSPAYKMHASNSPLKTTESPKVEKFLDNQIESIYQENISLSRFSNDDDSPATPLQSPSKKFPKVYIRKDLIQKRESEDTVMVIQNMFSPAKSVKKSSNTHLNNILERSCERYSLNSKQQNLYIDNSSVVKTLDFDSKKKKKKVIKDNNSIPSKNELLDQETKSSYQEATIDFDSKQEKKESKDKTNVFSKNELSELEAKCPYQLGDLAWARMGTYPFWPSIVTRDPLNGLFIKKKLCGRVERDVIHVTFFGDNGRRSWIMDNMLRNYHGLLEFETTRTNFTPQDRKKDPRLYAAYFVSVKKQTLWRTSVEEAEMLLREPQSFRIDIFNDMLLKSRCGKIKQPKSKMSRTDSDVSLSESLYDSLFSEDDGKSDNNDKLKNRSRNKSLDMFEVVTACLDNMVAKTGISKIQRQSHMDRWLQKAKSKTPEKTKAQMQLSTTKLEDNTKSQTQKSSKKTEGKPEAHIRLSKSKGKTKTQLRVTEIHEKKVRKISNIKAKKSREVKRAMRRNYSLRKKAGPQKLQSQQNCILKYQNCTAGTYFDHTTNSEKKETLSQEDTGLGIIIKIESLAGKTGHNMDTTCESETFTDESTDFSYTINSENNTTRDETISDLEKCNSDLNLKDMSQSSLQLQNKSKDFESINDKVVSENTYKSANSSKDPYLDTTTSESKNKTQEDEKSKYQKVMDPGQECDSHKDKNDRDLNSGESLGSVNPNSTNLDKIIKAHNSERLNSIDSDTQNVSVEDYISKTQVSGDLVRASDDENVVNSLNNCNKNLDMKQSNPDFKCLSDGRDPESQNCSNIAKSNIYHDPETIIHSMGLKNSSYNGTSVEKHESNKSQSYSNKSFISTEKDAAHFNLNVIDIQNQSLPNNMSIESDNPGQSVPTIQEKSVNIESSTPISKEKCLVFSQEVENDDENMSDDDSDSERLPYSPLSNLGNNSDDNLSVDDVPFINDPIPEYDSHSVATTNKKPSRNDTDFATNEIDHIGNLNNDDLKFKDHHVVEAMADTSKDIECLSHECDFRSKRENIENRQKEIENFVQNTVKEYDKKINITNARPREDIENITESGYKGRNVKELNLKTKEVRIYVSDCITETIKENGVLKSNGDISVKTTSKYSEDISCLSKSDNILHSKKDNKEVFPYDNPEFLKYVELRQDTILDENPELSEKEVLAYLYKTWLYEENVKSDVIKNDELRECNLVKGSNQPKPDLPPRKRNLSIKRNQSAVSNTGNLKMFLRRKKVTEKQNSCDEIYLQRNKGVKKNLVMDDDEDNDSTGSNNEWHILSVNEQSNVALSTSQFDHNKVPNDIQNLPNGEIKESEKNNTIGSKNITPKFEKSVLNQSKIIDPKDSQNITTKECKTDSTESSVLIRATSMPLKDKIKLKEFDGDSIGSEDSEVPLITCKQSSKTNTGKQEDSPNEETKTAKDDISIKSEESDMSSSKRKKKSGNKIVENAMEDPAFVKYFELRQDALIDENPGLSHDEIVAYLYQTWLYEENIKSEIMKTDEIEQSTMVKGLRDPLQQPKKVKRKIPKSEKTEKDIADDDSPSKPKRKSVKPFYNEEYSDIEDELEVYEIFKPRNNGVIKIPGESSTPSEELSRTVEVYDEVELYFAELTKPKPNIFKGLTREKVCEICENINNLVKCKGCNGMFHVGCVDKKIETVEVPAPTPKGRKKKKKLIRKSKNPEEGDNDQDISEENNISIEEIIEAESHTVDADILEAQLSMKMKEMLDSEDKIEYDSYSSDDCLDWKESVPGKCEIVNFKLKLRETTLGNDYSDFKCKDCQQYDVPVCFVCKGAVSNKNIMKRQNCNVAHCNKYYHLECLDHWPQTQFSGGEPSKYNKKFNDNFEAFTCPRHVCHTCVSDDPRGCKTRFSGDKLARCVRCPATYHSFTKCLPAGSQILTASHIICPRHHEHRAGKAPCHVNTGWCFICALGGSLICCEYCPTSFHAECLNIDPPEGGYMCEDCETGRLPLYGEMVWVKLGHYRWWPGIILHPYEIPENLLAVKHSSGEFVVRFFGQYDHYWVNRGRVFPFQEGDSGRISSQKSKIDAAFTTAVEHAKRACEILKSARPNEVESSDIASSLLPPHYVKLKVNKPCGSLCGRKSEDPESSLTQCECNPHDEDPCGPYSQCLNRMLLTECGPVCRAGDRCNNRAFEKRLYPKLVPYRTLSRGWGLKTLEDIKAGQFVIEYVGELIDEEECRRRMRRKHEMRDENFYFLTLDKERMIDAGPKGNLARFMNHCCEPNCETQKWTVLGDVRVGLFALYDIPAQSEVTFNYNFECDGLDKKRCMCGARRCSGYIGAKPKQEESQIKKIKAQPAKRTYKKRKPEESPLTKNKIKRPIGRPPKPKELTEIEKDLLIIRNATNGLSSDESCRSLSSEFDKHPKALKRKRVSFSSEEIASSDTMLSPDIKKPKLDEKSEGD